MADVFISYCSEDRPKASLLGAKLAEQDLSVWWDRDLIIGVDYYDTIEAELEASKAIVVLWSKNSVRSPWVRAEAGRAAESQRLLPAKIDPCNLPLRFAYLQSANLHDWRGGAEHEEWQKLLRQVRHLVSQQPVPLPDPTEDPSVEVVDPEKIIPKLAARLLEFLSDPSKGGSAKMFSVFRQFPEFVAAKEPAELWFGLGTKEALLKRLCEVEPQLQIAQSTGGAMVLRLHASGDTEVVDAIVDPPTPGQEGPGIEPPPPAQKPTVDKVVGFAAGLLAGSPVPVPLASVAMAIEAEFGSDVRKSRWLGCKTLKALFVKKGGKHNLKVGGKAGYLYDSARHTPPK